MEKAVLVGRERELGLLHEELERARSGDPRVVLVEGEAGIGKTALIRRFVDDLGDYRVLHASGDLSEQQVPFAVVDQLMRVADNDSSTPVAIDLSAEAQDPITVGATLLAAFGDLQGEETLVVVIDDAHWVDLASLQALTFALRRLVADSVLAVFVTRPGLIETLAPSIPALAGEHGLHLPVSGLSPEEVVSLAQRLGVEEITARDAERLQEHTKGNPLHVTALLQEMGPEELGERSDAPMPAPRSYAEVVHQRLSAFPEPSLRLIRAAAVLGMRAALGTAMALAAVGITAPAVDAAVDSELVYLRGSGPGTEVIFHHPLTHSAVYHRIPPELRSELHVGAAALATEEQTRLRHLVLASTGADPDLADELETFARGEATRGAWSSGVWGMLASADASPERERNEQRTLVAIELAIAAGDAQTVTTLAPKLEDFSESPRRAYILGLLAVVAGRQKQAEVLLRVVWDALGDPPSDPALAASVGGWLAPLMVNQGRSSEVIDWARKVLANVPESAKGVPNLGTVLITLGATGNADEGLELVKDLPQDEELETWSTDLLAGRGVLRVWTEDLEGARQDLRRVISVARKRGPFVDLALALFYLCDTEYRLGRWDESMMHGELAASASEDAGQLWILALVHGIAIAPLAGRGDWEPAEQHARKAAQAAETLGDMGARLWAGMGAARLAHARRDFALVVAALEPLPKSQHLEGMWDPGVQPWQTLYAEAMIQLGNLEDGGNTLRDLEDRLGDAGLPSARSDAARVRGMLEAARGRDDEAEAAFGRSLEIVGSLERPFLAGRNELAYGEFLRRKGRRRDASRHLLAARGCFELLGARPYTERTDGELAACGLTPTPRGERSTNLTPQEVAVATLVSQGVSNREAAAELVVSVKTIEYHLGHIYAKLGVRTRGQLTHKLSEQQNAPQLTT
jgi:DNA-binding CsgD family transcriptional regulator